MLLWYLGGVSVSGYQRYLLHYSLWECSYVLSLHSGYSRSASLFIFTMFCCMLNLKIALNFTLFLKRSSSYAAREDS